MAGDFSFLCQTDFTVQLSRLVGGRAQQTDLEVITFNNGSLLLPPGLLDLTMTSAGVVLVLALLTVTSLLVDLVLCHGRLMRPASRSTAWRLGYGTPRNYRDNGQNCGGYQVNTTHSLICGDRGGKYNEHKNNISMGFRWDYIKFVKGRGS